MMIRIEAILDLRNDWSVNYYSMHNVYNIVVFKNIFWIITIGGRIFYAFDYKMEFIFQ